MTTTVTDLLTAHGITPRRVSGNKGGEYHSPCPGCGGTDRFHVWPAQNDGLGSWWCRQCDAGGDAIAFLMRYEQLDFRQACARLQMKVPPPRHGSWKSTPRPPVDPPSGHGEPPAPPITPPDSRAVTTPANPWQSQAEKYVDDGTRALLANPAALKKLIRERGLNEETVRRFRLGILAPGKPGANCRFSRRSKWGLEPKSENKKPDSLWLPRGLIIPLLESPPYPSGPAADLAVTRIRIRRPPSDCTGPTKNLRYYVVPGSSTAPLYIPGGHQQVIVVVESELDAILLAQEVGDLVAVMAIGNDSARPDESSHQHLAAARLILLAQDNDQAGRNSVERWQRWYKHTCPCPLPGGHKDPGDAWKAGVDLRAWIVAELPEAMAAPPTARTVEQRRQILAAGESASGQRPPGTVEPTRAWTVKPRSGKKFIVVRDLKDKSEYVRRFSTVVLSVAELRQVREMPAAARSALFTFLEVFPDATLEDFRMKNEIKINNVGASTGACPQPEAGRLQAR